MKRFLLSGFLALMIFDTLAQISFKAAAIHALPLTMDIDWLARVFTQPWIYGAFIGYMGAFFTWMTLLKYAPIGPAFAASHLEIISVTLFSVWLFDDTLTLTKAIGGLLILAGILFLAKGEVALAAAESATPSKPEQEIQP